MTILQEPTASGLSRKPTWPRQTPQVGAVLVSRTCILLSGNRTAALPQLLHELA